MYDEIFSQITNAANKRNLRDSTIHAYCTSVAHFLKYTDKQIDCLLYTSKAEESKKRTHRLCQVGGAVESVLGAPIEEEDIPKLIGFLKKQEANGKFFSKAMQKETHTDMEEV